MDTAGEVSELLDRDLNLFGCVSEQALDLGVLSTVPALRALQLEGQRDEALLGAVVEIALEPPALFVACGHDPGA
jgi:hypothetical protein